MLPLYWLVGGLVAGWITGNIMSSEGRDHVMDIVMGAAGGLGGGFLFSATHLLVRGVMIYTMLAAVVGAVVLTVLSRYATGSREFGSTD